MPKNFKDIFRDAAELSERDRATLAGLLIELLESESDPEVEAAWAAEIERLVAELDAGAVKTIPWEEVRQRLLDRRTLVSFHPRARDEVEEAQAWDQERSLFAAAGFLQELSKAVRHIQEAPNRYPIALHGTRRVVLERFPFNVFCRVSVNEVGIIAVAHQKRLPRLLGGSLRGENAV